MNVVYESIPRYTHRNIVARSVRRVLKNPWILLSMCATFMERKICPSNVFTVISQQEFVPRCLNTWDLNIQMHRRTHASFARRVLWCTHISSSMLISTAVQNLLCVSCVENLFPYSRYLSAHKISVHLVTKFGRPKVHECSICKKTYKNRTGLRVHMDLHTGYVLICDICGKSLSTKEKLKQHYRIHTGDKPFKCQYCEKAFSKRYTLVEHERIHTGVKPYQCDFCERSFTQRSTLMTHRRNHTGERPYVCRFCNKGLVSHAMMNIHLNA